MPPETTGAEGTQADPTAQPQAGASSPPQAGGAQTAQAASATDESGTGSSDQPETMSPDEARKLRSESASLRKRLADLEKAQQATEEAKLSELEKAQKRSAELERQIADLQSREQERTAQYAAQAAATRLGFRSPDLAYRLLDRSEIEFADDGTPKNVERLLKALLEKEPYLAAPANPDFRGGDRGKPPGGQPSMNELLRAAAGRGGG